MCPNSLVCVCIYIISDSYPNSAGKIFKAPFADEGANTQYNSQKVLFLIELYPHTTRVLKSQELSHKIASAQMWR